MHTRTALADRLMARVADRHRNDGDGGEGGGGGGSSSGGGSGDDGGGGGKPQVSAGSTPRQVTFGPDGAVTIGGSSDPAAATGGRPGGPSLADQVAALTATIEDIKTNGLPAAVGKRQQGKDEANKLDEQIAALSAQVETLTSQQAANAVAELAQAAGAIDPFAVAKLVGDAADPAAAIAAMRGEGKTPGSHAYMFGKTSGPRRAGADMNGGEVTTGGGDGGPQTEAGKFLTDMAGGGSV